jgi:uncharacterized protein (TIGR02444 family)
MKVSALQRENEFWQFSLAVYGAPGVEAECLALQEALRIDVNLLLFCAWLGAARRIALTESNVDRARFIVQPWHEHVIRPLRAVRQQLKAFSGDEFEAFRTRVKTLELDAEQVEQAMLFTHAMKVWPQTPDCDAREIMPANVRIFLQSQRNVRLARNDAFSTPCLIEAAIKIAG